jgi:hypothetical protein
MDGASQEVPLLVVVPAAVPAGAALRTLLERPEVRHHALPAPWALEPMGLDLTRILPAVASITLDEVEDAVQALFEAATPERLDAHATSLWREADEQVRLHHLRPGLGGTLRSMLRMSPRSARIAPPASFVQEIVHAAAFEAQYRLARTDGSRDVRAPAEEASILLYPFDPRNEGARREVGLGAGAETILEVFAYEDGRERHRDFLRAAASSEGWRVIDAASAA